MAMSMFLKFEGPDNKGDSRVKGHEDEIDIHSWNFGITQSGSMHTATGGGSGKSDIHDIHITKAVDKSSSLIMKFCATGQHFNKATLMVEKAGGDKAVPYMKYELSPVLISSYSTGGGGGGDIITETIGLNFGKIKSIFTTQTDTGEAGAEAEFGYDCAARAPF